MAVGTAQECGCPESDCPTHPSGACNRQTTCCPFAVPDSTGWWELVWLCPDCYEEAWIRYGSR
jgi:hypothetical protein